MPAFIQHKNGAPFSISAAIAAEGFRQRGYEVIPFAVNEIDTRDWQREDPVVGGVETTRRIFTRLGVSWQAVGYPGELLHFLQRKVEISPLGQITPGSLPVFLKPVEDSKTFTGFVCRDLADPRLANIDTQTPVYACEPIEFLAEYRTYVLDAKILNIARYQGSADHFPNAAAIRAMIYAYRQAPVAYSLDVGVTREGHTVLVETNEAFSLTNYGLAPALMARMIAARWFQLTGLPYRAETDCPDSPAFLSRN